MKRCQTKGCLNPAFGRYSATTTRGSTREYYWCSPCGLNAHNKRSMRLEDEHGREYMSFPRQFRSVELIEILGAGYDGAQPAKYKPALDLRSLLGRDKQ